METKKYYYKLYTKKNGTTHKYDFVSIKQIISATTS